MNPVLKKIKQVFKKKKNFPSKKKKKKNRILTLPHNEIYDSRFLLDRFAN